MKARTSHHQSKYRVLVVDDDPLWALVLEEWLETESVSATWLHCTDAPEALELLNRPETSRGAPFLLCLINYEQQHGDSDRVSQLLKQCQQWGMTCFVFSGHPSPFEISDIYRGGGEHFFKKKDVGPYLKKRWKTLLLEREQQLNMQSTFERHFLCHAPLFHHQIKQVLQLWDEQHGLLLLGPTGSGKTTLAKKIHHYLHPKRPFVHLSCADFPDSILESTLFGHAKGSFSGAHQAYDGLLAQAQGGTLFLDEVGLLSTSAQGKLLKVLDEKCYSPFGSNEIKSLHCKLILATSDPLDELIGAEKFRRDLYFRISALVLRLEALSQRQDDLSYLIDHYISKYPRTVNLTRTAKSRLMLHPWPGNLRQLQQTMKYLGEHLGGMVDEVTLDPLLPKAQDYYLQQQQLENRPRVQPAIQSDPDHWQQLMDQLWQQFLVEGESISLLSLQQRIGRELCRRSLQSQGGKTTAAMKQLGINPSTFYRLLPKQNF